MRATIFTFLLIAPLTVSAQWVFEEHTDLITDDIRVFAKSEDAPVEESEESVNLGRLEISCKMIDENNSSNKAPPAIYHTIIARSHSFGEILSIIARVDKNEPIEFLPTSVSGVGGGRGKGYVRMASDSEFEQTKELLSQVRDGKTLVIRSVALDDNQSTFQFALTGVNNALSKLFDRCGLSKSYPDK